MRWRHIKNTNTDDVERGKEQIVINCKQNVFSEIEHKKIQKNDKNRMTWHQKSSDILLSHQQEIAKCQTSNNLGKDVKRGDWTDITVT